MAWLGFNRPAIATSSRDLPRGTFWKRSAFTCPSLSAKQRRRNVDTSASCEGKSFFTSDGTDVFKLRPPEPQDLEFAFKGALRLAQTAQVVTQTGLEWLAGDRVTPQRLLRRTFQRLGATYVKLGQFIASAPTLFPAEYVEEFQDCLDQTDPLPFSVIEGVLKEEFAPRSYRDVFSYVDPVPLASASIAQVHAARLRSGEDVVVKVQRPGAEQTLATDLQFLLLGAALLELANPELKRASIAAIMSDVQQTVQDECDFVKEARNVEEFRQFLQRSGIAGATAPRVYPSASTRRILTMERLYGVPLTDLKSIRKYSSDPEATLVLAMNVWISSVLFNDFFHADVHAGNLLVLRDGRVGFIDFGIVGRIPKSVWRSINTLAESVATRDYTLMAQSLMLVGATSREVDVDAFAEDLRTLLNRVLDLDPTDVGLNPSGVINERAVNGVVLEFIRVGDKHGIRFPREFALLLKQFLYFDRYTRALAPSLNVMSDERIRSVMRKASVSVDVDVGRGGGGGGGDDGVIIDTIAFPSR